MRACRYLPSWTLLGCTIGMQGLMEVIVMAIEPHYNVSDIQKVRVTHDTRQKDAIHDTRQL